MNEVLPYVQLAVGALVFFLAVMRAAEAYEKRHVFTEGMMMKLHVGERRLERISKRLEGVGEGVDALKHEAALRFDEQDRKLRELEALVKPNEVQRPAPRRSA